MKKENQKKKRKKKKRNGEKRKNNKKKDGINQIRNSLVQIKIKGSFTVKKKPASWTDRRFLLCNELTPHRVVSCSGVKLC